MANLRRLLRLLAPLRWGLLITIVLGSLTVGSSIGLIATSAYLIAKAALMPSVAEIQVAVVGVRFFGIARGVFRYVERWIGHKVTFQLLGHLRMLVYDALEPLAPAYLLRWRRGELLTRTINDIEALQHFYTRAVTPPVVAVIVAILASSLLGALHWSFALVLALIQLGAGLGIPLLTRRLSQKSATSIIRLRAELNATLLDTLQGATDLIMAHALDKQRITIGRLSSDLAHAQERLAVARGLQLGLLLLIANLAAVVQLWIAIPLVRNGSLDGVYLALIVLTTLASFEAIGNLGQAAQHIDSSLTAAQHVFSLIDAKPSTTEPSVASPTPHDLSIEFDRVSFGYDQPILQDFSLQIPAKTTIAITGASGIGKTTLGYLLLRFWDVQSGVIRLGGYDLREYHTADVYRLIGVMSQETTLFNGTLRENLLIAKPSASDSELDQVIEQAQLSQFIASLPNGYATWIGEQGLLLSGGERQRLAIARMLLKNAPIVLLDEPTAHLDEANEQTIIAALKPLLTNKTALIISHRKAPLVLAERVVRLSAMGYGLSE